MPKYFTDAVIKKGGKIYRVGESINLTENQAEKLGHHVYRESVAVAELDKVNAKEMRNLAKQAGVKNYSSKTKEELSVELEAIQNTVPSEAVTEDGSDKG